MQLKVEQEHIDEADRIRGQLANPNSKDLCEFCPISRALIQEGYKGVTVGQPSGDEARAAGYRWFLDEVAKSFMHEWDEGFPVYPITLELEEA